MTKISNFLQSIKVSDWDAIRLELLANVSRVTLTNWKHGLFEADARWWPVINAIAEKYGYDKPYTL